MVDECRVISLFFMVALFVLSVVLLIGIMENPEETFSKRQSEEHVTVTIVSADCSGFFSPHYTVSVYYGGEVYHVSGKDYYALYKNCIGSEVPALLVKYKGLGLEYYTVELSKEYLVLE